MKVVIAGGGMMGCATAYYLTKLGASKRGEVVEVTVVERCEIAGQASGKAGGFLAKDWCSGVVDRLARKSFEMHSQLQEELGTDVGYRRMETLMVDAAEGRAEEGQRKKAAPSWVDCAVRRVSVGGTQETTAQVHPRLLTTAFMDRAKEKGATVVIAAVKSVRLEGKKVTGAVLSNGETLSADVFVVAMGPWSGRARDWFPEARLPRVRGGRAHSVVLDARDAGITAHALFMELSVGRGTKEPELYPRPDGTVYVCGNSDSEPLPADPARVEARESSCGNLADLAGKVSSSLEGATVLASQACYLPHTDSAGGPLVGGIPGYDGAFLATAHSCWGILNGPATGLGLAELILEGEAKSVDIQGLDPGR